MGFNSKSTLKKLLGLTYPLYLLLEGQVPLYLGMSQSVPRQHHHRPVQFSLVSGEDETEMYSVILINGLFHFVFITDCHKRLLLQGLADIFNECRSSYSDVVCTIIFSPADYRNTYPTKVMSA